MSGKRVLIIEDDLDNTTLLRIVLEREQYEVICAQDGQDGMAAARASRPDLIVLDLDMPRLNGWDVLKQLKNDQKMEPIPIVVVTAHLMKDERNKVFAAGGAGYVQKPFGIQELVGEIQRLL
ncbi:MAG: response regulator [Anaerolineae bacterium]|nr:response regulator [Anaerolineae bacterium]